MDTRAEHDVPTEADPLTRQMLRQMTARAMQLEPSELPDDEEDLINYGLDSINTLQLIAAWHQRGIEVGFPELMAKPTLNHWWELVSHPADNAPAA
ncbi:Isochorismatase [Streptomyces sp. YIM 130001]|uniref:phosphopantetheine-binding protein n=1 Tax=Streptomyces sp. YIM 130001 TaxID=2259644 RepID=UPI000E64B1C1|nr:phosphopantetheine-binding protein [Streptomyces sp. YIM 130001]RII13426.1 Isochorismatase [Streptomyces sp. YIM 130001]